MFNSKKITSLLIAMSLTLSLSSSAYAATYKVVPGDSLYKIGKLFNTSTTKLMKDNKLSSNKIYPYKILNVPAKTYTIKKGDTLYLITKKYGVSVNALKKANNKLNTLIYPGQKLNIPYSNKTLSSPITTKAKTQVKATVKPKAKLASRGNILYSASEIDLLARLITAESDGQPYKAQVAVGAVVINRVKDSRFPNSIPGVIYEKSAGYYQFTPVLNGWINKAATAQAKKAAYEALTSDPSYGALYYFDDSTKNKWLLAKTISLRVGKMIFTQY